MSNGTSLRNTALRPLERWLTRAAPEGAHALVLSVAGLADTIVQRWALEEHQGTPARVLAAEMLDVTEGHAESVGRECRYTLRWVTEDERHIIAMAWRSGDGMERTLDGSAESQIAQSQRHLEAMMKLHAQGIAQNNALTAELLESQAARIRDLEAVRDVHEAAATAAALDAVENGGAKSSKLEEVAMTFFMRALESGDKKQPS